jgi:hypothetical protein
VLDRAKTAIPDEHIFITAVRFEGDDIIEADMVMLATQTGELFGIPFQASPAHRRDQRLGLPVLGFPSLSFNHSNVL